MEPDFGDELDDEMGDAGIPRVQRADDIMGNAVRQTIVQHHFQSARNREVIIESQVVVLVF